MIRSAYHVARALADQKHHSVHALSLSLGYSEITVRRAVRSLRSIGAPLKTVAVSTYCLGDWLLPWGELDDRSKLDELERVIAPGAETNLIECASRLQRENLAMRGRLMQESHEENRCQNSLKLPNYTHRTPQPTSPENSHEASGESRGVVEPAKRSSSPCAPTPST